MEDKDILDNWEDADDDVSNVLFGKFIVSYVGICDL